MPFSKVIMLKKTHFFMYSWRPTYSWDYIKNLKNDSLFHVDLKNRTILNFQNVRFHGHSTTPLWDDHVFKRPSNNNITTKSFQLAFKIKSLPEIPTSQIRPPYWPTLRAPEIGSHAWSHATHQTLCEPLASYKPIKTHNLKGIQDGKS